MTPPPARSPAALPDVLEELVGTTTLRPGQREAITSVLERDTLAVLATGLGKSLVYQVATRLLGGHCVVVSPTLSLQSDQLAFLIEHGYAAASLNGDLGARRHRATLDRWRRGEVELLLLAPEQFAREDVLAALTATGVGLFTVDEAHCVSAWGHDFRPDYLALGAVIEQLGHPRTLALTATASPQMRAEILGTLEMSEPAVVVGEVDRPNIELAARVVVDDAAVTAAVQEEVASAGDGTVLVYAATRRRVEELAGQLTDAGAEAAIYHGALPRAEREATLAGFRAGRNRLVVATSAFGLGVDKPDVRLVVHADPPGDLDAYYQEIGRAGRDGEPASAHLITRPGAYGLRRYFAAGSAVDRADLLRVLAAVPERGEIRLAGLREATGWSAARVRRLVNALTAVGAVIEGSRGVRRPGGSRRRPDDATLADRAATRDERFRTDAETGVELVRRYAETDDCRRRLVLQSLGEDRRHPCGNCDNCARGLSQEILDRPWSLGQSVRHVEWGLGTIFQYEHDRVTVHFTDAGYRTLETSLASERQLLRPAG